jgi:octaprenyl-diphosphate synthase
MNIDEIITNIKPHLEDFNKYFKELMKSDVALLNIILRYINTRTGKQMRPVFVFLTAELSGGINKRSYIGAALVELLHTATLVHDDVVDEATERRGIASINAEWNNKIAVLVGDYMLSLGLITASENCEFAFLNATSEAVKRMSKGELLSIEASQRLYTDEETYYKIIADKTASLISACCEIGALSGSNNKEYHSALKEFGEYLGTAFQIRDDILDLVSKNTLIGKPVGNDIKEKKVTLPLIYALSQVSEKEKKEIVKIIKRGKLTKKEINSIITFTNESGGIEYAENKAKEYLNLALSKLDIFPDSNAKTSLINLANFVLERSN